MGGSGCRRRNRCDNSGMSVKVDIRTLTAEERLTLIGDIWDSLAPVDVPVSKVQADELDRRLDDLDADPDPGIPWNEVLRKLRARTQE